MDCFRLVADRGSSNSSSSSESVASWPPVAGMPGLTAAPQPPPYQPPPDHPLISNGREYGGTSKETNG
jgi:hypothetical protein